MDKNSSFFVLTAVLWINFCQIKIIMKILRTISQKQCERVELRLIQYNIQLTEALVPTTLRKTLSCVRLKALWLQSVGFAKGMITLVSLIMKYRQFLKSFEKLLRPTNNYKLICGFVWEYVCMGVYVLWEWGRKANFFFSKWYWIQKQMKRLKSADPNMSVNFKIYFKATKDLTK